MSEAAKVLRAQLVGLFGESFGQVSQPIENLSEAVEDALLERRRARKAVRVAPPSKVDFGQDPKAKRYARDKNREAEDRIKKNLDAFYKYADREGEKSAARPRPSKLDTTSAGGGSAVARKVVSRGGTGGGNMRHNPFKHSPNLGTGPGTPPGFHPVHGKRHHDERKCWHCTCGNVYDRGCECVGTGATEDCPKGHTKHVQIKKAYRHAYNDMYHAWRRGEGSRSDRKDKWQGPRK